MIRKISTYPQIKVTHLLTESSIILSSTEFFCFSSFNRSDSISSGPRLLEEREGSSQLSLPPRSTDKRHNSVLLEVLCCRLVCRLPRLPLDVLLEGNLGSWSFLLFWLPMLNMEGLQAEWIHVWAARVVSEFWLKAGGALLKLDSRADLLHSGQRMAAHDSNWNPGRWGWLPWLVVNDDVGFLHGWELTGCMKIGVIWANFRHWSCCNPPIWYVYCSQMGTGSSQRLRIPLDIIWMMAESAQLNVCIVDGEEIFIYGPIIIHESM